MSVIVMGMEMPKSCSKCRWFDMGGGYGYQCTLLHKSFEMWNKISVARDRACPLIEVPTPHGRLIDADELVRIWTGAKFYGNIKPIVDARPTVIEAEGSAHEQA